MPFDYGNTIHHNDGRHLTGGMESDGELLVKTIVETDKLDLNAHHIKVRNSCQITHDTQLANEDVVHVKRGEVLGKREAQCLDPRPCLSDGSMGFTLCSLHG